MTHDDTNAPDDPDRWSASDEWLVHLEWAQAPGIEANNGLTPIPGEPGYEAMAERLEQIRPPGRIIRGYGRPRGITGHGQPD